jgi:hypothetical protein
MLETGRAPRVQARLGAGIGLLWALTASATGLASEPHVERAPSGADLALPPPIGTHHMQYGVALAVQTVVDAAHVCPEGATAPCILGSGGGLAIRVGYRGRGDWYFGGAYEFSRLAASNLLRLPILQQLRAEARYEPNRASRVIPYFAFGVGVTAYGNEWGVDTGGIVGMVGPGVALQLSRTSLVGAALSYRPLVLSGWTDSAGERRADSFGGFGAAHMVALELTFEIRSALSRW